MDEELAKNQKTEKSEENDSGLVINPIPGDEEEPKPSFLDVLAKLSPGKSLRLACDDILRGKTGALIVLDCPKLNDILEGGFRVNCKFSPQRLAELAKMDGAVILSDDLKRILLANVLLVPDKGISTNETGTRHKSAERTSKQAGTPVIAISERRGKITLFYDNKRYPLQDSETLLRRATENLNILEKQREICDELLANFNLLEITSLVSVGDVCSILQRIEMMTRVLNTLKRYIIELGNEGLLIQMRVRELFNGIKELESFILKDYTGKPGSVKKIVSAINFEGLLDLSALSRVIFESESDKPVSSRGYRLLERLNLTERELRMLVSRFGTLGNILAAAEEDMQPILRSKASSFKRELELLKEKIMMGKKV